MIIRVSADGYFRVPAAFGTALEARIRAMVDLSPGERDRATADLAEEVRRIGARVAPVDRPDVEVGTTGTEPDQLYEYVEDDTDGHVDHAAPDSDRVVADRDYPGADNHDGALAGPLPRDIDDTDRWL